jgi:ATP-binding protein involved in chromosome partitioning
MSDEVTREAVLEVLKTVDVPDGTQNIVDADILSEVVIQSGKAYFAIKIDPDRANEFAVVRSEAEKAVSAIDGIEQVVVTLTADRPPEQGQPHQGGSNGATANGGSCPSAGGGAGPAVIGVPGIKAIIAVASGKGGVGKSTTAVNLALAFKSNGLSVGILDADIYGPSLPRLMGVQGPPQPDENGNLMPMEAYGMKLMSMGFLVEEDTPMIWRGPMVISALTQMLQNVAWGELDVLVVDMPPGTGDTQLTMSQQVPLAGAIIVSTPQDLALIDARKGLNMFKKVSVPVLGIVENMSYFLCPSCGERSEIFGHGGASEEAARINVEFLGEIPLDMRIRETSDAGEPIVASDPDSPHAKAYGEVAAKAWSQVETAQNNAPKIVVE